MFSESRRPRCCLLLVLISGLLCLPPHRLGQQTYRTRGPTYDCSPHYGRGTCLQVEFDVAQECARADQLFGSARVLDCMLYQPVLTDSSPWSLEHYFDRRDASVSAADLAQQKAGGVCDLLGKICRSGSDREFSGHHIPEAKQPACDAAYGNCRSALRHIVAMLYKGDQTQQQCNNFALKAVRGMFHDYMTTAVDGSILEEVGMEMNSGLCRWAQYVNVLSDATKCEPAAIISMAGILGTDACGFPAWQNTEMDWIPVNNGHECRAHLENNSPGIFDPATGQRRAEFSDALVSSDSATYEKFFCAINPHGCEYTSFPGEKPWVDTDGEVQYATEATAAAHIIGRVTCAVSGQTKDQQAFGAGVGHFHKPRGQKRYDIRGGTNATGVLASLKGIDGLRARYYEGLERLQATQCTDMDKVENGGDGSLQSNTNELMLTYRQDVVRTKTPGTHTSPSTANCPDTGTCRDQPPPRYGNNGGIRTSTDDWLMQAGETNLNSISGAW